MVLVISTGTKACAGTSSMQSGVYYPRRSHNRLGLPIHSFWSSLDKRPELYSTNWHSSVRRIGRLNSQFGTYLVFERRRDNAGNLPPKTCCFGQVIGAGILVIVKGHHRYLVTPLGSIAGPASTPNWPPQPAKVIFFLTRAVFWICVGTSTVSVVP